MKLVHPLFLNEEIIFGDKINTLVIEDPKVFTEFTNELYLQSNNINAGQFVLSQDNLCIDFSTHSNVYINYFCNLIDNNKNFTTKLNKHIQSIIQKDMHTDSYILMGYINEYLKTLCSKSDLNLSYDLGDCSYPLIKTIGLNVDINTTNILEKLIDNLDAFTKLFDNQVFFMINPRLFFNEDELKELYKIVIYKKWNILNIERSVLKEISKDEKIIILDKDLCVF